MPEPQAACCVGYRLAAGLRPVVERDGLRLVADPGATVATLAYPEAAGFELLERGCPQAQASRILAAVLGLAPAAATAWLADRAARWVAAGLLAPAAAAPAARPTRRHRPARPPVPADGAPAAALPPTDEWVIPYIDRPPAFWRDIARRFGAHVREVYFPLPHAFVGSGRPPQPAACLDAFLAARVFRPALLLNPVSLPAPAAALAPAIIAAVERLVRDHGLRSVTVADRALARQLRRAFRPGELTLVASTLMDVASPAEAARLAGVCDVLVPPGRVLRNLPALRALRAAFPGRIRLLVNEACIPGCPFRDAHFRAMAAAPGVPPSPCAAWLGARPWLRLTGAFVLPQHLRFYAGLYDELKLAGRVTLRDPRRYRRVLGAYIARRRLTPDAIGGGPASVLEPLDITEDFFRRTLFCSQTCEPCCVCRDYFAAQVGRRQIGVGP